MTSFAAEDRVAICDSFRRLLAGQAGEAEVRRVMETPEGYDPALWRAVGELGITGLLVDPEHGGVGGGPLELEAVMEEAGAALFCGPLLTSAVLAAALISRSTDVDAKARLLPGIASGETIATVALTGEAGTWDDGDVGVSASPAEGGWKLDGVAGYVLHAQAADVLLVVANTPEGVGVFEAGVQGVTITPRQAFDLTLRIATVAFQGTPARRIEGADAAAVAHALDLARVALAGEQTGAARRIFEITLEYIRTRVQFGRPIGGFQAIKHMAADLLVELESCTSAARAAAQALAEGDPEAGALVSLAGFACSDAFAKIAADAIQMHGGIAFTWAHPAHLYFRRARADALLFGSADFHRERYLAQLEAAA